MLVTAALFILAAAAGPLVMAPPTGTGPYDHELRQVADGIYVAVRPDVFRQPVEPNVVFVVNDRDVVVVDPGGTTASAESALALLRGVTDKPVRYIVNTHWHGDHNLGNGAFLKAFPGAEVVAHVNTLRGMTRANIGLDATPAQLEEAIASLGQGIASGRDDAGQPLPAERLARWRALQSDYQVALAEVRRAVIVPPTLTFEDALVLRRGAREIEIRYLGRGNTDGDAIVWLPRERILLSGDLVVHPQPYGLGSYPAEWVATLEKLIALDPLLVVPGHGEILHDTSYLRSLQALIRRVQADVAHMVQTGATLAEARARLDIGAELRGTFTANDPRREGLLKAWFLDPFVASAYKEAKGLPIVQGDRE